MCRRSAWVREAPPKIYICSFGHCPFGGGSKPLPGWFVAPIFRRNVLVQTGICMILPENRCHRVPVWQRRGGPMAIWAMPKWTEIFFSGASLRLSWNMLFSDGFWDFSLLLYVRLTWIFFHWFCTDMIFVKSFTPADFPQLQNLPEKVRNLQHFRA